MLTVNSETAASLQTGSDILCSRLWLELSRPSNVSSMPARGAAIVEY